MKRLFAVAALACGIFQAQAQAPPPATADPYANNPDAGKLQFPLAAPAGKDSGAMVVVIPTVDTVAEGVAGRDWTYFPPLGKRSNGGGQAFDPNVWGDVPGGYRNTINDNVVLIEMIETLEGVQNAREIAAIPGV